MCRWTINSPGTIGALAISPNNAVFFHRNNDGPDKIQVRYTTSGDLREEFVYPFVNSSVQIVSESATKVYILQGNYVDEVKKEGSAWSNTWRWDLGTSSTHSSDTRIALVGNRWLLVFRGTSWINVYDRVNRSSVVSATIDPSTSSLYDIAVSPDGTQIAIATASKVYVHRTSDWAQTSFFNAPLGVIEAIDWYADGDLAVQCDVGSNKAVFKTSTGGAIRWNTPGGYDDGYAPSICVSRSGLLMWFANYNLHMASRLGADLGRFGSTGYVRFVAPGDDWVFTANNFWEVIGYNTTTGALNRYQKAPTDNNGIEAAAFGGGRMVWSTNEYTYVLNPAGNTMLTPIPGGTNQRGIGYRMLAVSRNSVPAAGSALVATAKTGNITMYRTTNGSGFRTLNLGATTIRFVQFSDNGQRFMALTTGPKLMVWSTSNLPNSPTPEAELDVPNWSTAGISPDGNTIIIATHSETLRFYKRNGLGQWAFTGEVDLSSQLFQATSVSFTPDGARFLVGAVSGPFGQIEIWNTNPAVRQLLYSIPGYCEAAAFSYSGQTFYYGSRFDDTNDGHLVCAWNPFRLSAPWTMTAPSTSVVGGSPVTFTLTLSKPAPGNGFSVPLASSLPSTLSVPSSVVFNLGETAKTFQATTSAVASQKSVVVSGAKNSSVAKMTITVKTP